MKILLLFFLGVVSMHAAEEVDLPKLVRVLIALEGGSWNSLGGAACMNGAVWRDRTSAPYARSRDPETALPVYEAHLRWLHATLVLQGRVPTVERLARCWRWGIEGSKRRHTDNYGERAAALYYDHE